MRAPSHKRLKLLGAISGLIFLGIVCFGQNSRTFAAAKEPAGLPWDWSHERVVFSNTTDPKVLAKIRQEPRFLHQQMRRGLSSLQARGDGAGGHGSFSSPLERLATALNVSFGTTVHAAQSAGNRQETLASSRSFVRDLQVAVVILGVTLAVAFMRGRHWAPTLATVLAIGLFLILASCGGAGTPSDAAVDPPDPPSVMQAQALGPDWGANIGAGSVITAPNANNAAPMYPAKYSFYSVNIAQTASCSDYVVFPTGVNGANTGGKPTPSIMAFNNLYVAQGTSTPTPGFCGTGNPTVAWAYLNVLCSTSTTQSNDIILSSPVLSLDGTKVAWVTSDGKVQILTIGTTGSNGTVTAPVCIENAPGGAATSPNNAVLNSVALSNAKEGTGHSPNVSFSAVFVDYGSDSAYVTDDDGYMHKITPFFTATSQLQEVNTLSSWTPSTVHNVGDLIVDNKAGDTQECTHAGTSGSGGQPGWSSNWGATTTDNTVTWTNEGPGGGWPVYVTGTPTHTDNTKLSAPVFDPVSKNIFVGDTNGSLFYVLDPGASTAVGSCANLLTFYPCLGAPGTTSTILTGGDGQMDCSTAVAPYSATCMVMSNKEGFTDPVTVDSTNNLVITQFSDADGTHAEVEQTNTSLSVFHTVNYGVGNNDSYHSGTFDNLYFSSPATGFYYVCGQQTAPAITDLYRVSFTVSGSTVSLGTVTASPLPVTHNAKPANCSGLTEIYNATTTTDWLFLSVDNNGVAGGCGNESCVMSFVLGSTMPSAVNASYDGPSSGVNNMNGTSGIIVDNVAASTAQASSLYFAPVANNLSCGDGNTNTVCAIKLTDNGLQ